MSVNQKKSVNETHLGYIQNVITRMGQNSFQSKAWCITLMSAMLTYVLTRDELQNKVLGICIIYISVTAFLLLDTYYLYLERGYRELYKIVAGIDKGSVKEYDMSIPKEERGFGKYIHALFSVATGLFYLVILFAITALLIYTVR